MKHFFASLLAALAICAVCVGKGWITDNTANSSFSPTDLSNLVLWLDAQNAGSITKDGSNNVSQWNDLSGNSNHATASTTARPVYNATTINGHPAMTQTGSPQVMTLTNTITQSQISVFMVVQPGTKGARQGWFGQAVTGNTDFEAGQFVELADGSSVADFGNTGFSIATNYYWSLISSASPATTTWAINTSAQTITGSTGASYSFNINMIGARAATTWNINGAYGEYLIYSRSLNSTEQGQVKTYLAAKWGI